MKIKRLVIENFKSIERIELVEPNPFTVFVGPNGSGKSNIFEALEFVNLRQKIKSELVMSLFGGSKDVVRKQAATTTPSYSLVTNDFKVTPNTFSYDKSEGINITLFEPVDFSDSTNFPAYQHFLNFTRIFTGREELTKLPFTDGQRLSSSAKNLEKVLKRVLLNSTLRNEIFEWLELFIPEFKSIEIDERDQLHWFEEFAPDYFTKDLISDGTYNIIAFLTAIYQSDRPQFLCIEEPENGLNPKVVKELVNLCRYACEEFGHYIWLNTHSQTLVSQLTPDEIILVDKKEGATQTKQIKGMNLHGLPMDEAWLSNALGGGLPW